MYVMNTHDHSSLSVYLQFSSTVFIQKYIIARVMLMPLMQQAWYSIAYLRLLHLLVCICKLKTILPLISES